MRGYGVELWERETNHTPTPGVWDDWPQAGQAPAQRRSAERWVSSQFGQAPAPAWWPLGVLVGALVLWWGWR